MSHYTIASFYKFVALDDCIALRDLFLQAMKQHHILGTIILAQEGINGGFGGLIDDMKQFYAYIQQDPRFADIIFKETVADMMPFDKAKVKIRKEIVTMGVPQIDPRIHAGTRLMPDEWNALISDPNVVVVDTRNDYEVELGTFRGAINPQTEHFRDFPEFVQQHLLDKKDQKIAMFCTGGIRCEKSTAYLKSLGFSDVYQLDGGILNYFDTIPTEESLWEGTCFVFDERITVAQSQ